MTNPTLCWYPDPRGVHGERFWNGNAWTASIRSAGNPFTLAPAQPVGADQTISLAKVLTFGLITAAIIGAAMQLKSVSLMTGAGTLWIGAALASAAALGSLGFRLRGATQAITVVLAVLCPANCVYAEKQLDQQRQQIQQIFNSP